MATKFRQQLRKIKSKIFKIRRRCKNSALADYYLKGKRGIEIGGSYHNRFNLNTLNINYTDEITNFTEEELSRSQKILKVDIVAPGDDLPFKDNVWDFVINSHVLEHFYDPVKAINEWMRVIKPGGYLFMIIPHKERTFDKNRERTTLNELIERHNNPKANSKANVHYSVWITEDVLELCKYLNLNVIDYQDKDDKVGNGFTIVVQKDNKL